MVMVNGIKYDKQMLDSGRSRIINMLYSILGSYENCETESEFTPYIIQIDRVTTQMTGFFEILGSDAFLTISATLKGMSKEKNITHKKVKSLIFYCIDLVKKVRVVE